MSSFPILSAAIWVPIVFGGVLLLIGSDRNPRLVRWVALLGSLLGLLVTVPLFTDFERGSAAMQFVERRRWIDALSAHYHLGVDGLSVWFVLLTAIITVFVVVAGWEVVKEKVAQYMAAVLFLSGLQIGVFA